MKILKIFVKLKSAKTFMTFGTKLTHDVVTLKRSRVCKMCH